MSDRKINVKNLKARCRDRGLSVTALAQRIGRARTSVYLAAENPKRYSATYELIVEALR